MSYNQNSIARNNIRSSSVGDPKISDEESEALKSILSWVHIRMGIYFEEKKMPMLYSRLNALCRRLSLPSIVKLREVLVNGKIANIEQHIAETVTTNHTHFFREMQSIEYFVNDILPKLPNENLRIWSAAASSGDEAYTLLIMLVEKLGLTQAQAKISILGTDISSQMIEEAERGIYPESKLLDVPKRIKQMWFHPAGLGHWIVNPHLKQMVLFRQLNLKQHPWPFSRKFHVVFLRNVLYYFDRLQQQQLVKYIYDAVATGGWLVTSVTESITELDTPWTTVIPGVHRKL